MKRKKSITINVPTTMKECLKLYGEGFIVDAVQKMVVIEAQREQRARCIKKVRVRKGVKKK